jgi:hypothetical protein
VSDTGSPVRTRGVDEDDFWPDDRPTISRRSKMILLGAAVVVVVIIAVVAVVYLTGGDKAATADGNDSVLPTVYVPTAANEGTKKLNQRSGGDQRPLNDGEVFSDEDKTVSHAQYTFSLVRSEVASDCRAVWGERLKADLRTYACTQIVRGAYLSKDQRYVGQFIALNLNGIEGSQQIVRDLDPQVNAGFVSPLAAAGVTNFGTGFSAAYPEIYGHYVVLSWVQRKGGARPNSMNELLDASLAIERAADFVWGRLVLADN